MTFSFDELGSGINQIKQTIGGLALFPPSASSASSPPLPDFVIEGAGCSATGGEGGTTYEVTNLNDSGAGSFRDAVTQSGARIVNVLVSGYIDLQSRLNIDNPNMTINGDAITDGGKGICLRGQRTVIRTNNIIIRHVRFKVGDSLNGSPTQPQIDAMDSLSIVNNGTGPVENIVLDHCTVGYGVDECLEVWNTDTGQVENISIQWCIIDAGLRNSLATEQNRGKGLLNGPGDKTRNISVHHCLFSNNKDRNPQLTGTTGYDVVSNVLFNIYGSGKIGLGDNDNTSGAINVNVRGNLEVEGPDQNASGMVLVRLQNKCAAELTDLQHQIYLADDNQDKDGDTGWSLLTACDAGASNIPANTRFEVADPFAVTGCAITVETTSNLIDILANGTGYAHAGVGASPGGADGRDARDQGILDELIVARDSGPGSVDTAIIRPVDSPSQLANGGYPSLAAAASTYAEVVEATEVANLIGYWKLDEGSGPTATDSSGQGNNGVYAGSGVTYSQTGIGDGSDAILLDGSNGYVDIYSANFNTDFNGAEGTAIIWAKVSAAGVWTDATTRAFLRVKTTDVAVSQVRLRKQSSNNAFQQTYEAANTEENNEVGSFSSTEWVFFAITWSATGDIVNFYYRVTGGSLTSASSSVLGIWGSTLNSNQCVLGAQTNVPADPWSGYLAHAAIWSTPLSLSDITTLSVIPS